MLLSEIKGQAEVCPTYFLKVEPGEFQIAVLPFEVGTPGYNLEDPKVFARNPAVFDRKHENDNRKWWTRHAGVNLCIVIPKDKIEVVPEVGYSYPKFKINGETLSFSTSGGTSGNGTWTDWLTNKGHVGCNAPLKVIRKLLAVALTPQEATAKGFKCDLPRLGKDEFQDWTDLALAKTYRDYLKTGQKLSFSGDYKFVFDTANGATFDAFNKNKLNVTIGGKKYQGIAKNFDWTKTATENKWEGTPNPDYQFNKCGVLTPSFNEQDRAFHEANADKPIVVAAWGHKNTYESIPEGFVGVVANIRGHRARIIPADATHYTPPEDLYFLVPEAEYEARGRHGFVIDTARHQTWVQGPKKS